MKVRRRCPICKLIKEMDSRGITCSKACSGRRLSQLKGPAWLSRRSKLGGRASGTVRHALTKAKYLGWVEKFGIIGACQEAYKAGYHAGHSARRYYELAEKMQRVYAEKRNQTH
jgi:hypothetical protein